MTHPGYVSNSELAKRLSDVVDRWNRRENQMIALLTQEEGSVTVTDGLGVDHVLPSFLQLNREVSVLTDDLTGAVAQVRDMNSTAVNAAAAAEAASQVAITASGDVVAHAVAAGEARDSAASSAQAASSSEAVALAKAGEAAGHASTAAGHAAAASSSASSAASSASSAASAKVSAEGARDAAALWAGAPPGTEVEPGEYSARHWANQAQASAVGSLVYMGAWDASEGVFPPTPATGHFYKVVASGVVDGVDYNVGDQIVYDGAAWDKIDNTDQVSSVAGKVGAVSLVAGDIGGLGALATRGDVDWNTHVTGKPVVYPAAEHSHGVGDVSGLQSALDGKASLSGAVFTGSVTVEGASVILRGNANRHMWFYDADGSPRGLVYSDGASRKVSLRSYTEGGAYRELNVNPDGTVTVSGGHEVLHTGNFDPASKANASHKHAASDITGAINASSLDGLKVAEGATASTIPSRNSAGDIFTRLFRSTYQNNASMAAGAALAFRNNSDTDNYIRFVDSPSSVRSWLGLGTAATSNTGAFAAASHNHSAANITSGKFAHARIPHITGNETTGWARLNSNGDNADEMGSLRITTGGETFVYTFEGATVFSVNKEGRARTTSHFEDSHGAVRKAKHRTVTASGNLSAGSDLNGIVEKTNTAAVTLTIPSSLGTAGDIITVVNSGTSGNVTVARGSGVTFYRNGSSVTSVVVAPGGNAANFVKLSASGRWQVA